MKLHQSPNVKHATRITAVVSTIFSLIVGGGLINEIITGPDAGPVTIPLLIILMLSMLIIVTHSAFVFKWTAKYLCAKKRFTILMFLIAQVSLLFLEALLIPLAFKLLPSVDPFVDSLGFYFFFLICFFVTSILPVLMFSWVWLWFANKA